MSCGYSELNFSSCPANSTTRHPISDYSFDKTMELFLIPCLCLVGLFGNLVSVIVLRKDKERKDALVLLQALAVADTMYVLTAITRFPLGHLLQNKNTYAHMQLYVLPLLKTSQTIAIWMVLLVTVERYTHVCKPLCSAKVFKGRKRFIVAGMVFVFGFIFNVPRFFDSCVRTFYNPCTGMYYSKMIYRPMLNDSLYFDIYRCAMYIVFLYIGPLSLLLCLNIRLIQAIRHSKRRQRQMSPTNDDGEYNATVVLIIVVVVFIICETPEMMLQSMTVLQRYAGVGFPSWSLRLNTISQVLMVVNSSTNFFIYCAFGRRFRWVMKQTFSYRSSGTTFVTHESLPLQYQRYG